MLLETVGGTQKNKPKNSQKPSSVTKTHRRQKSDQNPLTLIEENQEEDQSPTVVDNESPSFSGSFFGADGPIGRFMASLKRGRRKKYYGTTSPLDSLENLDHPGENGGVPNSNFPRNDSGGRLLQGEEENGEDSVYPPPLANNRRTARNGPPQSFITRNHLTQNNNNIGTANNNYSDGGGPVTYQRIDNPANSPFVSDQTSRVSQSRRMSEASYASIDSTAQWNEDFSHRPSWCDAGMALQQIKNGKATGNKPALWVRSRLQWCLFRVGCCVQSHKYQVLACILLIFGCFCFGLRNVTIQTDIVKLWVEDGGRLHDELNFLEGIKARSERMAVRGTDDGDASVAPSMTPEGGLSGGFQVVIETPRKQGLNILTTEDLLLHVDVLTNISSMPVTVFGEEWTLADLCFKPPAPQVEVESMTDFVQYLLDKIVPCVLITPLDCFWEGSKPLGPFPPLDLGKMGSDMSFFIPSLPKGNVSWKNLHPANVIRDVQKFFDLGMLGTLFDRAGIRDAYQNRPCIDPLDRECPPSAPNHPKWCEIAEFLTEWNRDRGQTLWELSQASLTEYERQKNESLEEERRKSEGGNGTETADSLKQEEKDYEYEYYDDGDDYLGGFLSGDDEPQESVICKENKEIVRKLLKTRPQVMKSLPEELRPGTPDFGRIMTGGCKGFASEILNWPEDLIVGGVEREQNHIKKAEALQSVLMVASSQDIYVRYKHGHQLKPNLNKHEWSPKQAEELLNQWSRNFTHRIYNWKNNTDGERQVHPLASTSVSDMLDAFSSFKPFVILIGYALMLVYSGLSLCSCRERGVQSCTGLGVVGVLIVTFASASGLGLSTLLGIEFNAATTQIVPFLTLGLGVDDMFLLVHNYKEVVLLTQKHQLGYLLKETGLSVLLTSINNILAFLAGGLLPVPALRSFCLQTAILLVFNAVAMLTIFPAVMAIDLVRRQEKRVDIFCCFKINKDKIQPTKGTAGPILSANQDGGHTPGTPPPPYELAVGQNGVVEIKELKEVEEGDSHAGGCVGKLGIAGHWTLHHFVKHVYTRFLQITAVKVTVILFFMCMLGCGVIGLTKVQQGLELTDVIPRDTAPYAFLSAREKYFSFYPMYAVIKGPVDFPHKQKEIREYRDAIGQSEYVVTNQGKLGEQYWLSLMLEWLDTLQMKYDQARQKGLMNATWISPKASDEAKLAFKLTCNTKDYVNCSRNGGERLVDASGNINPDGFYNYLTAWYNVDPMMYYVSQASFYPNPPKWDTHETRVPPAESPMYSQIPFFLNKLVDTPATVDAISKIRRICDQFAERGLPNFPQGIPFTFWEQYLHLSQNLLKCLGIITACVFVVITLLLLSPWTAGIVVSVLVMMVVELCGFMGLVGLKLNPVSAVSLITAVGIGVEFTVHISLSYLTAMGTKNERMAHTLDHMFIPVIHGGISTLLGIIMLAFSEFEFIVRYFFMVMSALIVIGLLNGLVLLPVLLSLIGPKSEVETVDGSNHLAPPSPKMKKKHFHDIAHSGDFTELTAINGAVANGVPGSRKTPPQGIKRHAFGRNNSGSNVPYRRHDSLSTIDEESTPPSSTTPPGLLHQQALVNVAPVHVVVHTGTRGAPLSVVDSRGKKCRSWTVSGGSAGSPMGGYPQEMTIEAKQNVQIRLHHSLPGTPTNLRSEKANFCDNNSNSNLSS